MERKDNRYLVEIPVRDERGAVVERVQAISFRGLLALAHEDGLSETETEILQFPTRENRSTTIVRARVRTKRGTFIGIGDANPENVSPEVALHVIRCAETRALARALRIALSIGDVSDVEILSRASVTVSERRPPPPIAPRLPSRGSVRPAHEPATSDDGARERDPREERDSSTPDERASHRTHIERFEKSFRGRDRAPTEAGPNGGRLAMSAEQRKYLFRLVYSIVPSKDLALERVLTALGVERLEYATRAHAARAIDSLKEEIAHSESRRHTNGNGTGNGKAPENGASHD
jgi:hypothetical protein